MENQNIVLSCKRNISANANECNRFVIAVANDFGIKLKGAANEIFNALKMRNDVEKYGAGWAAARLAAEDALHGKYLVIGASFAPARGDHGHVAVVTGLSGTGEVLVYGGVHNHPEMASKNIRIQSKCWAAFKLNHPYVAAQPPEFFGLPIPIPFVAG